MHAKLLQSCLTLCNMMDYSPGFFKQEYLSGLPCPLRGDLPNPHNRLTSRVLAGRFFSTNATWEPAYY